MEDVDLDMHDRPTPGETYRTLKHRKVSIKTDGPGRPNTGQVQINVKCTKEARSAYVETCDRLVKSKRYRTRGDVFADMVASFAGPAAKRETPKPPKGDSKRPEHRDIFFQRGLIEMLEAHRGDQTLSCFVQDLIENGFASRELQEQNDQLRATIKELGGADERR